MTIERFTIDANVLFYHHDGAAPAKRAIATDLLEHARSCDCILTRQALAELFHALVRKRAASRADAARYVRDFARMFPVVHGGDRAFAEAVAVAERGVLSIWDALLMETAREAGCRCVLSEDMADGRSYRGVTVLNPFAPGGLPAVVRRLLQME